MSTFPSSRSALPSTHHANSFEQTGDLNSRRIQDLTLSFQTNKRKREEERDLNPKTEKQSKLTSTMSHGWKYRDIVLLIASKLYPHPFCGTSIKNLSSLMRTSKYHYNILLPRFNNNKSTNFAFLYFKYCSETHLDQSHATNLEEPKKSLNLTENPLNALEIKRLDSPKIKDSELNKTLDVIVKSRDLSAMYAFHLSRRDLIPVQEILNLLYDSKNESAALQLQAFIDDPYRYSDDFSNFFEFQLDNLPLIKEILETFYCLFPTGYSGHLLNTSLDSLLPSSFIDNKETCIQAQKLAFEIKNSHLISLAADYLYKLGELESLDYLSAHYNEEFDQAAEPAVAIQLSNAIDQLSQKSVPHHAMVARFSANYTNGPFQGDFSSPVHSEYQVLTWRQAILASHNLELLNRFLDARKDLFPSQEVIDALNSLPEELTEIWIESNPHPFYSVNDLPAFFLKVNNKNIKKELLDFIEERYPLGYEEEMIHTSIEEYTRHLPLHNPTIHREALTLACRLEHLYFLSLLIAPYSRMGDSENIAVIKEKITDFPPLSERPLLKFNLLNLRDDTQPVEKWVNSILEQYTDLPNDEEYASEQIELFYQLCLKGLERRDHSNTLHIDRLTKQLESYINQLPESFSFYRLAENQYFDVSLFSLFFYGLDAKGKDLKHCRDNIESTLEKFLSVLENKEVWISIIAFLLARLGKGNAMQSWIFEQLPDASNHIDLYISAISGFYLNQQYDLVLNYLNLVLNQLRSPDTLHNQYTSSIIHAAFFAKKIKNHILYQAFMAILSKLEVTDKEAYTMIDLKMYQEAASIISQIKDPPLSMLLSTVEANKLNAIMQKARYTFFEMINDKNLSHLYS